MPQPALAWATHTALLRVIGGNTLRDAVWLLLIGSGAFVLGLSKQ